jgi:hypothetical protein
MRHPPAGRVAAPGNTANYRSSIFSLPNRNEIMGTAWNGERDFSLTSWGLQSIRPVGDLFPRVGFIVTNLTLPSRAVVRFYNISNDGGHVKGFLVRFFPPSRHTHALAQTAPPVGE